MVVAVVVVVVKLGQGDWMAHFVSLAPEVEDQRPLLEYPAVHK